MYDQYATEVKERFPQLVTQDAVSSETAKPVNIKLCLDPERLNSTVALGFIDNVTSVGYLTEKRLRTYLDSKAADSKELVAIEKLCGIFSPELYINMREDNATSSIQKLSVQNHNILRRNGLS